MFRGNFEHVVDDKGRVAIPARFREALSGLHEERLVVTKFGHRGQRCLDVYPLGPWRRLERRILSKNGLDPRVIGFRNYYVGGAQECQLDGQGRILVPEDLRKYAGLGRDAMFAGDIDKFRIWNKKIWQEVFEKDEHFVLDNPELLAELEL
jgi:transcriptional regulator MraZ